MRSRAGRASWWLLVVALCVAPAVRYLGGGIHPMHIGNADMLAVPAVVDAVRDDGLGVLGNWYWPPAPYFVPDFVLYLPIWSLVPDAWSSPAVFMVVQLGLLAAALTGLAAAVLRAGSGSHRVRWSAAASFSVVVALAAAAIEPARFVLVSYYRGGSLLLAAVAVALLARLEWWTHGRRAVRALPALVLGAAVLAVSDPLAVPATMAPAAAVLVGQGALPVARGGIGRSRASGVWPAVAVAAGAALGLLANGWLVSSETTYGPALTASTPGLQARRLEAVLWSIDDRLVWTTVAALALVAGAALRRHRGAGRWSAEPFTVALAFWTVSVVGHVAGIVVDTTPPAPRYLVVVLLLPIALAGPALVELGPALLRRPGAARAPWAPAAVVALAAGAAVVVPAASSLPDVRLHHKAAVAACLDDALPTEERRTGIAGYWAARLIQLHSDHERRVAPVTALGVPFKANAAADWFEDEWTFALIGLERDWEPPMDLIRTYAPDADEVRCGQMTVFRFDGLDPIPMDQVGDELRWSGCGLRSAVGRLEPDGCRIHVPRGAWGYGSFGGYTPLDPGRYDLTIRYGTDAAATPRDVVAVLEVTRGTDVTAEVEVTETHDLHGTAGGQRRFTTSIEVPDDGRPFVVEARTRTEGAFGYHVDGVVIERVTPIG